MKEDGNITQAPRKRTTTKKVEEESAVKAPRKRTTTKKAEAEPVAKAPRKRTTTKKAEADPAVKVPRKRTTTKKAEADPAVKVPRKRTTTKKSEAEPAVKAPRKRTTTKKAEIEETVTKAPKRRKSTKVIEIEQNVKISKKYLTNIKDKIVKIEFKKFLKIYVIIIIVLMLFFLIHVYNSLKKYENNQIDNYMNSVILDLKKAAEKNKLNKYIDVSDIKISKLENDNININNEFKDILKNKKITYKLNENSKGEERPIYTIYADEIPILDVHLDGTKKENRLSLLTFAVWKVEKITSKMEKGLYTCNISVPNNLKVYLNDKELTKENIIEKDKKEELKETLKYVKIPYIVKYQVTNLIKEPKVRIIDENNKEVEYKKDDKTSEIYIELKNKKIAKKSEAMKQIKGNVDIETIAKNWSLYLTDDLKGDLHGFYNISKYLIKDSTMYKNAYKWATGVDISYVSAHTLSNPIFSNVKIKNFEIYNEEAFSCEVYLKKNIRVNYYGSRQIEDVMHERIYFVYYDDTKDGQDNPKWKVVNMQSITEIK